MNKLLYIVAGTGRSGTVGVANTLTSVGVTCGHEAIFTNKGMPEAVRRLSGENRVRSSICGGGRWFDWAADGLVADASYMAAPHLADPAFLSADIIHAVRDPIKVIFSFVVGWGYFSSHEPVWMAPTGVPRMDRYHRYIYNVVPSLAERMHPLTRASRYYVAWNLLIERNAAGPRRVLRHRVEDGPEELFEFFRLKPDTYYSRTDANSSEMSRNYGTLADVPEGPDKEDLIRMGERYGYAYGRRSSEPGRRSGRVRFL